MSRTEQREQAFCLVFQNLFNNEETLAIYEENVAKVGNYAKALFEGVDSKIEELDEIINAYSKGWKTNRLPKVNLAILRLAIYEIKYVDDVPASVAINEAVELAKKYSGEGDYSFINGVLGSVAKGEE
ncbi:transcription antitermination factor NusB [uncultured Eubacterium sp.]|uniref:transcription antitermination factor NusB n=1 Tax=uncultured Eubacterium sp. TaxID=165185 RepID=UPI0025E90DA7|nr:transcription antitermination factor NusB [uncultured Eubacterium sp.]